MQHADDQERGADRRERQHVLADDLMARPERILNAVERHLNAFQTLVRAWYCLMPATVWITARPAPPATLDALEAHARLARETGMVVHLVVPRAAGVVAHARTVAARSGLGASVDLRPYSVRVRFDPTA